ncbi:PTS sugar transporter subunit IIA [Floccifex sp.]|uniref:PTS sugar transporter subunit IIA n=1 Tax=Floccifex sp. TaxID=2815810 RepID=UPI003F0C7A8D
MGLFSRFKKEIETFDDRDIVAIADGNLMDLSEVKDPVFSQKMMGDGIAFQIVEDKVTFVSPTNGTLSLLFPTGHAFGVTTNEGVELLVHIGIDTVQANGKGFKVLKKQGDVIKAMEPVVQVDMKLLSKEYDMTTMLIVTNPNEQDIQFISSQKVNKGQKIRV